MSQNDNVELINNDEDEIIVVCKDCFKIQNPEKVMKSNWYKTGAALPPCSCGGQTMEINRRGYERFVDNRRKGYRY